MTKRNAMINPSSSPSQGVCVLPQGSYDHWNVKNTKYL